MECTPAILLALLITSLSIWFALVKVRWHMNNSHILSYGIFRTQERKLSRKSPIIIELSHIYSLTLQVLS
jgi:hypothetical protein